MNARAMEPAGLAARLQTRLRGRVETGAPLDRLTSYRVGGTAELLVSPASSGEAGETLAVAAEAGVSVHVLGGGSNVVVDDGQVAGVVLHLAGGMSGIRLAGGAIEAEAGALNRDLALFAAARGIDGYGFLYDIPGRVGGLAVMNAGNDDGTFADLALEIDWLDRRTLELRRTAAPDCGFGYRESRFRHLPAVVVAVRLSTARTGDPAEIRRRMELLKQRRWARFPMEYPNAGSVFKRPPGDFAGRLIESAGCGGISLGGAAVSRKHHGFIVNTGGASAADIRELTRLVQARVEQTHGVRLEREQIDLPERSGACR